MRNQDLILAASKCRLVTRFRNTIGLPRTMAVRVQPNHPTDDRRSILASVIDWLRRCRNRHQSRLRLVEMLEGDYPDLGAFLTRRLT
jgi:hypothetical protein